MDCPYCKLEFYYDSAADYYDCMNKSCIMYSFRGIGGKFLFSGISSNGESYTFPINLSNILTVSKSNIEYIVDGCIENNKTSIFDYQKTVKLIEFKFIPVNIENLCESITHFKNLIEQIENLITYI